VLEERIRSSGLYIHRAGLLVSRASGSGFESILHASE
jgi:hypothetical protein